MPMIDIYATAGTFADPHKLATDAAALIKTVEGVPAYPCFARTRPLSFTKCQKEPWRMWDGEI